MEDPLMVLVPDVAFHGTSWEGNRAQIGPETINDPKCVGVGVVEWDVCPSYRVVGCVRGVVGSRVTGKDRQPLRARH